MIEPLFFSCVSSFFCEIPAQALTLMRTVPFWPVTPRPQNPYKLKDFLLVIFERCTVEEHLRKALSISGHEAPC